jgi:hypothetical protein
MVYRGLHAVTTGLVFMLLTWPVCSCALDEHLSPLAQLLENTWIGKYADAPEEDLDHVVRWEEILDGRAIRYTKEVPQVGFSAEGLYYWDPVDSTLAFLMLSSKGHVGEGTISTDAGMITLKGVTVYGLDSYEFRTTFEVREDGTLEDKYYRKYSTGWRQGHLIRHVPRTGRAEGDK